jgi:predicted ribosomally synthesized peptide with SipW-like signal peptide
MKNTKKLIVAIAALSILLCCAVGGTLAYLRDKTNTVTNTFTYGDINITLTETERVYKMIPGTTLPKDPKVTVEEGSEACWLFIKVEKTNNPDTYLNYSIDTTIWKALPNVDGVYYCEVSAVSVDTSYPVLKDNQVVVKEEITKEQMTAIGTNYPTLSFTAYAVQKENVADVTTAWSIANGNN